MRVLPLREELRASGAALTAVTRQRPCCHYPPNAACVMCAAPAAAHIVEIRGGCVPVCRDCLGVTGWIAVVDYVSTHPASRQSAPATGR